MTESSTDGAGRFLWENKVIVSIAILLMLTFISVLPPLGALIAFILALCIVLANLRHASLNSIGFRKQESWGGTVLLALLLGIAIEFLSELLLTPLIEQTTGTPIDLSAFESMRGNFPAFLMMLALGWIVGGFLEEFTFRGFLITRLMLLWGESSISLLAALLITSGGFGISHHYQGLSGMLSTGIIAFVFGIIFIKSQYNLWLLILTHGFVNTVGLTMIYLNLDKAIYGIWK